jgi:hypothetical protein
MSSTKMSNKNFEICLISDVKRYKIREKLYKIHKYEARRHRYDSGNNILGGRDQEELKKASKSAGNRGRMT